MPKKHTIAQLDRGRSQVGGPVETPLALGTAELSADEALSLDHAGYVVFENLVLEQLSELQRAFETVIAGTQHEPAVASKTGTRHAAGLQWRPIFRAVALHPRLIAAVHHVLRRRFVVRDIGARDPLPGYGQQGLHADWHAPPVAGNFAVVTALVLLDEYTRDSGATRVVPGTHRLAARLDKAMASPQFTHPREVTIQAKTGSALVFNGHLWHSATKNRSRRSRRTLQINYVGHELHDPNGVFPPEAVTLSAAERQLLGLDAG